ncbi:type II secretion system protein GspD [Janthinobacterium lividum]|jgi:type IVB pilus formation R64 PilN family outer membrane protein|uniref:type II secretion system protein GspD n=1 Tax=Janthinobacterium sp. YR213 TaxID=1881027 RepID=UPI0008860B2B|nr:hypothetical protein [Janthinobacterium sp. YR213]SDG80547.1 type IVB pilus formation outer membrane protein, R64 PilN family [Janthinobacterium sp. YR213]
MKKIIPLGLFLLSACTSPQLQRAASDDVSNALNKASMGTGGIAPKGGAATRGSSDYADKLAAEQSNMPVLRRSKKAWLGSQMVPVTNDDKLPSVFKTKYWLEFNDKKENRFVSLTTVATRLTELTGVAVRVQPDALEGWARNGEAGVQRGAAPAPFNPQALGQLSPSPLPLIQNTFAPQSAAPQVLVDSLEMKWNGTLVGFLNHLTDRLGLAWEFRDNTVVIMKYVTEFHEVAAFSGQTNYSMSTGGASNGSSGTAGAGASQTASTQLEVKESEKEADAVNSIMVAVKQMISSVPGSTVTRSEGSGRMVVKTSREMQSQVRDFLKSENTSMLRQAQIQFDIYSVRTADNDERGLNWSAVFNTLSGIYGANITSPSTLTGATSGSIGLNILNTGDGNNSNTSARFGNSSVIVNLLKQYGTSVQYRPVSLLALNRTWAKKSRLSTEGYLAETTPGPASSTGVGAPGLKTDKITTGDQYVALPQILDNNTVLLKFGVSLSDLLGLFDVTVGSGLTIQKVQTPRVSSVNDQYTVALKPGEVIAISGLSRLVTTTDQRSLAEGASIGWGGSRKIEMQRENFVIFVRPVIL